jgi:hypothetical protein
MKSDFASGSAVAIKILDPVPATGIFMVDFRRTAWGINIILQMRTIRPVNV